MNRADVFFGKIPNCLPNLQNDCAMSYSSTTSSISIWMVSYSGHSQNPNGGGGLPCFQYPTGDLEYPASVDCGSSGTPLHTFTSLSSSTQYWILVRYQPPSKTFAYDIYNTQAAAIAAQNAYTGDGQLFAVSASADTSAAITPTAGGTGSRGGGTTGGGGRPLQ